MKIAHVQSLEEFGTRSLVIHGIMVIAFANAILAGLVVGGEIGTVSFVALLNLTAGLWVAHSIHSLGNVGPDAEYRGVINELFDTGEGPEDGFDSGRFGRLLALIAAVTAVALLTSAQVLSGPIFSIGVVAVGAVAVVTAIVGFFIALGAAYDDAAEVSSFTDERNTDGRHAADR
ncbi:hypothetical protein [Natrarchaeobius chitinivorans]|uniref:Uncharacterized protein n=1 Tax=Natrarchaeobius chitinivorans TaxID=1679083 RepID=A0A3N6MHP2_NATCH|nr:hypothetical protein [Natrarchaeobius chitinivorans]RQG96420.1 hypothetical protein EA473_04660 [Natrarchaeobius chitinivorans]